MVIRPFKDELLSLKEVKNRVNTILSSGNENLSENHFIRIEIDIEKTDPLEWLRNQKDNSKFYFRERNHNGTETAGFGALVSIQEENGVDRKKLIFLIEKMLKKFPENLKFYGGLSFFNRIREENWKDFGTVRFFIPKTEIILDGDKCTLALNVRRDNFNREYLSKEIKRINPFKESVSKIVLNIEKISEKPDFDEWERNVNYYLNEINGSSLKKIVASRCVKISFSDNVDPYLIIKKLKVDSKGCSLFLFVFDGETFFLGSTPEMLYIREGSKLKSEAVAGTRPSFPDSKLSGIFEKELLSSDKEQREHNLVVNSITGNLEKLCKFVSISKKKSLKLSTLQHIYTKIDCILKENISDKDIIFSLMPTPAVSGEPLELAMEILEETEGYDRGWYTGAVGFLGKNISSLYVSIRSVLAKKNNLVLYSGAGIVSGSDAMSEWNETKLKLKKFMRIIRNEK